MHGAVKHWSGVDPELYFSRSAYTISLTLNGGSDLTGSKISGTAAYEGCDSPGCITFVPPGADRRGWYRNVSLRFLVLLVNPAFLKDHEYSSHGWQIEPFTNRRDPLVSTVLASLATEMQSTKGPVQTLYAEHAAGLVLAHLGRMAGRSRTRCTSQRRAPRIVLDGVFDFIENHLDRDIRLQQLGALLGMGPDVFARHFRAQIGMPPYKYVMARRMQRAVSLLIMNELSIAEIALQVGFSSQTHFTVQFGRYFGCSPGAYRTRACGLPHTLERRNS